MNKTEPLSTSTQNPKIELPNKTLVGVKSTEKKSETIGKVPKPTGWRILVLPFKQKEKTKGGIILADETVKGIDSEKFLILPHKEVAKYIQGKAFDYDAWIQAVRKLVPWNSLKIKL